MKLPDFYNVRRGEVTGYQSDGPPLQSPYWRCPKCNGMVNIFDFATALAHDGPLPHPAEDAVH